MSHDKRRIIRLVERRPKLVRLGRRDRDFLATEHSHHVEIVPQSFPHTYCITSRGVIGAIRCPTVQITIASKVPARNLASLFGLDQPPPDEGHGSWPGLLDLLARHLAGQMKLRAGQGLVRAYVERTAVLPHLRGRLDLAAQLRQPIPRPDAIPCEIDELTDDIAINQLPRAIAEWLVNHPQIDNLARSELRDAIRGFDRVSSRPIAEILKSIEQWPAVPDGYETLHRLCVLLVPPSVDGASFLINLERAFEDYVERGARRMSSGIHVLSQPTFSASHHGDSVLTFRPDLLICRNGDPLAIIDAKWKRLDGLPEPADVHQVIAYAAVARAPWAVLAYPGRRLSIRTYEFAGMPRSVVVIRLGLDGPTEALAQGFDRLARILRI